MYEIFLTFALWSGTMSYVDLDTYGWYDDKYEPEYDIRLNYTIVF